jgi:S-DNA-T family DNA segregation ATPase FtsK/SpoIIIE
VDLLSLPELDPGDNSQAEINENGEKLIDTLDSFRVTASIKGVDRGPRITRYEVVPARGVKVSAITNLFDDISLALAADGVRMEAPIPGKSAIGFEIPNKKPATVYLRDLIESSEFRTNSSKTFVCIGKDVTGNPVFGDISKMPHVLVAGATGMGKSVCINSIMMSLLFRARPDEVKFIMIDPKKVEFSGYNGIPHLLVPVVIDPKQAAGALMWAVEEMEKRFDLIEQAHVKKIDDYNAKVRENPELGTPMAKIVIVIDELNDLMVQVRDPVENLIMRIAQKARAAGIHLIIGTQRPSVNVITGVIKANIPSRISCKVSASVDSRTILERAGAEKLLNNGDMLFHPVGLSDPIRVQGAFVTDAEVEAVMEMLKKQTKGNSYDEQAIEDINRAAKKCSKKKDSDFDGDDDDDESSGEGYLNDQKFLDAVDVAIKNQKIATSLIQRKLSIGYGKAAKYIDVMESLGIVGEANGPKPREVLISMDEWHEMLARRDLD